jgi:hypothetical protein
MPSPVQECLENKQKRARPFEGRALLAEKMMAA